MKAIYCLSCSLRAGCLSGAAAGEIARTGGSVNDSLCLKMQAKKKADNRSRGNCARVRSPKQKQAERGEK